MDNDQDLKIEFVCNQSIKIGDTVYKLRENLYFDEENDVFVFPLVDGTDLTAKNLYPTSIKYGFPLEDDKEFTESIYLIEGKMWQ